MRRTQADNLPFAQMLRDAVKTAGHSQHEVANRIGVSQGYVSQILRGYTIPNREILTAIIREYELPEREALVLAGYEQPDTSGALILLRGMAELEQEFGAPISVASFLGMLENISADDAREILRLMRNLAEKHKKPSG